MKNSTFSINYNLDDTNKTLYFEISLYESSYSLKSNIIEVIYNIIISDENNKRINPFDLVYYYDLNIFCNMKLLNDNILIESFPNYYYNLNLQCNENFKLSEEVQFGINIYQKNTNNIHQLLYEYYYLGNEYSLISKLSKKNDDKFSISYIQNEYINLILFVRI